MERIDLVEAYPSKIASMLVENEIDLGLIPVAAIPQIPHAQIITDYCIGATQEVASVAIFSEVPMEQISTLILDYQSRTSVNLARILLRDYWKKEVVFEPAQDDFIDQIKGTTAAVVIGDRALDQQKIVAFSYDLASAWIAHTGLPFVFAAWVANKKLPDNFISTFNETTSIGLNHISEIVSSINFPDYDLQHYYTQNIDYQFDEKKKEALKLFLNYII